MMKDGHNIFFLALTDDYHKRNRRLQYDGFDVYFIYIEEYRRIIEGTCSQLAYIKVILKIFNFLLYQRSKYDIIHIHTFAYPFSFISICGKVLKKKSIVKVTMSNEIEFERIGRISSKLIRYSIKYIDKIIAISSEIANILCESNIPKSKIVYIPNSVDTHKFKPIPENEKNLKKSKLLLKDKILVTFIGGITFRKGINKIIDEWYKVIEVLPNCYLLLIGPRFKEEGVIGDDFCLKDVKQTIKLYNMENNIECTGPVNIVEEYLKISDLFIFPSFLEGMPNVVLEAMSCGVPVVSYHVSGINDILRDGKEGIIIEQGRVSDFINAVIDLLQNKSLRKLYSESSYNRIRDLFSINMISKQYNEIYYNI